MAEFEESRIRFKFDDAHWSDLVSFDDHTDYKKAQILEGTKGIDFLGKHNTLGLTLIEVKNFRSHRIESQDRLGKAAKDPIEVEMGQKVKDSLAVMLASAKNSTNHRDYWQDKVDHIKNPERLIWVILWLEEDTHVVAAQNVQTKRRRVRQNTKLNNLKKKLSWLTKKVAILNSSDSNLGRWNIDVQFLPENPGN